MRISVFFSNLKNNCFFSDLKKNKIFSVLKKNTMFWVRFFFQIWNKMRLFFFSELKKNSPRTLIFGFFRQLSQIVLNGFEWSPAVFSLRQGWYLSRLIPWNPSHILGNICPVFTAVCSVFRRLRRRHTSGARQLLYGTGTGCLPRRQPHEENCCMP